MGRDCTSNLTPSMMHRWRRKKKKKNTGKECLPGLLIEAGALEGRGTVEMEPWKEETFECWMDSSLWFGGIPEMKGVSSLLPSTTLFQRREKESGEAEGRWRRLMLPFFFLSPPFSPPFLFVHPMPLLSKGRKGLEEERPFRIDGSRRIKMIKGLVDDLPGRWRWRAEGKEGGSAKRDQGRPWREIGCFGRKASLGF